MEIYFFNVGNAIGTMEMGSINRNCPIYPDTSRSNHNLMVNILFLSYNF